MKLILVEDVGWVVPSLEGYGCKEVSPDISMTYKLQQRISNMKMHIKGYDKVSITERERLER
jgi:hypothetical protein